MKLAVILLGVVLVVLCLVIVWEELDRRRWERRVEFELGVLRRRVEKLEGYR